METQADAVAKEPGAFYDLYKEVAGPLLQALGEAENEKPQKSVKKSA